MGRRPPCSLGTGYGWRLYSDLTVCSSTSTPLRFFLCGGSVCTCLKRLCLFCLMTYSFVSLKGTCDGLLFTLLDKDLSRLRISVWRDFVSVGPHRLSNPTSGWDSVCGRKVGVEISDQVLISLNFKHCKPFKGITAVVVLFLFCSVKVWYNWIAVLGPRTLLLTRGMVRSCH